MIKEVALNALYPKKSKSVNPANFKEETFALYSIGAYDNGKPDILKGKEIGSSKKMLESNDVILSRIVPHIQRCWVVPDKKDYTQIGSGEWIVFRNSEVYPDYLRYYLISKPFHSMFMSTVKGVGGSLLRADPKQVGRFKIALPRIETQKQIAKILDDAAALRDKTKKLLEEYDLLAQSIFIEMFGDPVINQRKWVLKNLKKSVSIFKDGPFGSNLKSAHYTEKGVRIIRLQNIGVNEFVNRSKSYVSEAHAEKLRNYTCLPGDILIATMGTPNIRACRFPNYIDKALNKADCLQLRPNPKIAVQDYLLFLINSNGFLHLVTKFFHGQTRSRVSMGQMAKLSIPIPPLGLQHEFTMKVALIEQQKTLAKKELQESEDLFNCLLQKAFKGELV